MAHGELAARKINRGGRQMKRMAGERRSIRQAPVFDSGPADDVTGQIGAATVDELAGLLEYHARREELGRLLADVGDAAIPEAALYDSTWSVDELDELDELRGDILDDESMIGRETWGELTLEEVNEVGGFIVTYHDFYRRWEPAAARRKEAPMGE